MSNFIPIFYACDDNFAKYTIVSIRSLIDNASDNRNYHIYILNTGLSEHHRKELTLMQNERFSIFFPDVTESLEQIRDKLPLRDYYTKTTYFRLFIPELFPQYDKAVYIDSDTIILGDIAELYDHDLKDNYIAASHDQVMVQEDVYGTYVEKVIGIDRHSFFNAGILVFNCKAFREKNLLYMFTELLSTYNFVVTQDEDYLNLLCKDRVLWLHPSWNVQMFGKLVCDVSEMKIVHYIMVSKPWHYHDCRMKEYFWSYAEKTGVIDEIKQELENYTDEERERDAISGERLAETARRETAREDNYLNIIRKQQAPDRVAVLKKIDELEEIGVFDVDVEDDPPGDVLEADDIEYVDRRFGKRVKTKLAFFFAKIFVKRLIRDKQLIIKDIIGIENFKNLDSGAIVTCNHFNAFDSFAIQLAYLESEHKSRKFYRVIREGNYTGFPGFYGYLMRNCDTLPLSSSNQTMVKFIKGVSRLLKDGHFVLFYPEQSMWWNYRKPKPLKDGAYWFAAKNNVPVLPCFITMRDSEIMGEDGFYVQEYTIHVGKTIYPDPDKNIKENSEYLREENFRVWKEVYEKEYDMPLVYKTDEPA